MAIDLRIASRMLARGYALVFLVGFLIGYSGASKVFLAIPVIRDPLQMLFWPLSGLLAGMLWAGIGALPAVYLLGLDRGAALDSYLRGAGSLYFKEKYIGEEAAIRVLDLSAGIVEALSFLYASIAGMYLAAYYLEIFESGLALDETQKMNFHRKLLVGFILALVAFGLRAAAT